VTTGTITTPARYQQQVEVLRGQLADLPADAPVRLRKRSSNLFRPRAAVSSGLDVDAFVGVLSVDPAGQSADVLGMTTYEELVEATLRHGLMPLVVPQLKTITLGGAVTGLGVESSSFRNGCPHESVLEMDILTGDGRVVTARPDGEHRDLFYGFPNSYGTLGYALRLRIELEPVAPYVHLRHLRFGDTASVTAAIAAIADRGEYDGKRVAFLDGTVFSPTECYLTLGSWVEQAPRTSDYTGQQIYYRSIQQRSEDWLTVSDYLWRWDTDWFWCSRTFGAQHPVVRRFWPTRWRRSDVYWKIVAFERRHGVMRRIDAARGKLAQELVIQDVEVPVERLPAFLRFLDEQTGIRPVWLCPMRQRNPAATSPLYPFEPSTLYVNVGFWSSADLPSGQTDGFHNRAIEAKVAELDGRKSLYSTAFYPQDEFWAAYGGSAYAALKQTYDHDGRLLDLYTKAVLRG